MDSGFFWPIIKQKNRQKISAFLSFFFLGISGSLLGVMAAEDLSTESTSLAPISAEDLIVVPTQVVAPLQIIVNDPEPKLPFSGEILSRKPFVAKKVLFSLYDDNGLIVWEGEVPLNNESVRVVPFYFPKVRAEGDLRLVVKAQGASLETLAMGERPVSFPLGTDTTKIVSVLATLEDDNTARIEMELEGGAFNETFIPHVKIYKEQKSDKNLYAEYEDIPVKVLPQTNKKIAFKVDNFLSKGLYILDVGLKDFRTKEPLEAHFSETIFSPGDYVRINEVKVSRSAESSSKIDIGIKGLAFLAEEGVMTSTISVFDGTDKITENTGEIALENGYFEHVLQFGVAEIRPDFNGKIELRSASGESLTVQSFDFSILSADWVEPEKTEDLPLVVVDKKEPEKTSEGLVSKSLPDRILKWGRANSTYLAAGFGVLFLLFVLIFLIKKIRHHLFWIGVGASSFLAPWLALSFNLPFYPTVEWVQPSNAIMPVYNPDSSNGFQIMPIEGRLYNGLTGQGFFGQEVVKEWRINFIDAEGQHFQFSLDENYFATDTELEKNIKTGFYRFYIDLSKVEEHIPLGDTEKLLFTEGGWRAQLLFRFYDENNSNSTWYATDYAENLSEFIIDKSPPKVELELLDSEEKILDQTKFTNKPITAKFSCRDEFSDCLWSDKKITVKGNFCEDGTLCDSRAAREVLVCDLAQNCVTKEILINFYDPIPPTLSFFNFDGASLARVSNTYNLSLRYEDPRRADDATFKNKFMSHVCESAQSGYYLNESQNQCYPKGYPCVFRDKTEFVRGHDVGKGCNPACPEGFEYKNGSCQVPCNNESFLSGEMCFPFLFSDQ